MRIITWIISFLNRCKKILLKKPFFSFFSLIVLLFHLLFIFSFYSTPQPKVILRNKKLLVKTHHLPQDYTLKTSGFAQVKKKARPQDNLPKSKPTKKTTQTSKPQKKETKQILKDLQESLAKIETSKEITRKPSSMHVPQPIKELKADHYQINYEENQPSHAYSDLLISFLKGTLQLPAFGSVKLALSLYKNGKIKNVNILYSDSEVNRLYLERELEILTYPLFTEDLSSHNMLTFTLTFFSN